MWQPFFWEEGKILKKLHSNQKWTNHRAGEWRAAQLLFYDWQFAESEKVAKYILRWYLIKSEKSLTIFFFIKYKIITAYGFHIELQFCGQKSLPRDL